MMSKYLTAGWEKLNFIVTPEELEEVLKDMHFLVVNCYVPEGYRETPAGNTLRIMGRYTERWLRDSKLPTRFFLP